MTAYIVGLTGGIATGKTNVTDALRQAGAYVVDADEVSRALTKDQGIALPLIRKRFGENVFLEDGSLDRRALGKLIFADSEKRKQLDQIMLPLIIDECKRLLSLSPLPVAFLSAPLLYECGMDKLCREVWCTYVPQDEQVKRVMTRDQADETLAKQKIESQMSAYQKAQMADHVIYTGLSRQESANKALQLYRELLSRLHITL
ncbi:MAG: dephospho-CoA kinase [Clostridiales bacterium]|nr:dephospho-CoA kinase [Clostridiales bacterium]